MPGGFVRNTFFGFVSGGASLLAGFVGNVIATRLLGPEGTGVLMYAVWCITVAAMIADLGVGVMLRRFVPNLRAEGKHDEAEGLIGSSVRVSVLAVIVGGLLLFSWLHWPARSVMETASGGSHLTLTTLVLAGFIGRRMADLYMFYLQGEQRFGTLARLSLLTSVIQVLATVVGAWVFGVIGALAAYVVGTVLPAFLGARLLRMRPGVGEDLRRRVVRFALTTWSAEVIGTLAWSRSVIVFVERYIGIRAVGLFSAASTVTAMATEVPALLPSALLPYFSEQHGLDARQQMDRAYRTMTGIVALLAVPACVGLAAIAPVFVPLLFGAEFADAAPVAMVLMIPTAIYVVAVSTTNLIYSTGRNSIVLISNAVGLAGTILLAMLLIPRFGLVGAALSRAVVQLTVDGIHIWYARRKLGFSPPYRALAAITLASMIQGVVAYGLTNVVGGVASLVLAIPAAVIVYVLALRALSVLPMLDPELVGSVVAHAPPRVSRVVAPILKLISPGSDGRSTPD
jgi:O-antigen/teichoic acid export membrane protein